MQHRLEREVEHKLGHEERLAVAPEGITTGSWCPSGCFNRRPRSTQVNRREMPPIVSSPTKRTCFDTPELHRLLSS